MAASRITSRGGFTLVELLLVIAIIGLLISLMIPAIQASRESARRTQCTNNLYQFGVAFSNFESLNSAFPAGLTIRLKGPLGEADVQAHGVIAELLPFLEEDGLAAQYHLDAYFCGRDNATAVSTIISSAICPTTPRSAFVQTIHDVPSQWFAGSLKDFSQIFAQFDNKYSTTYQGAVTDYAVPIRAEKQLALALGYKIDKKSSTELRSMFPLPDSKKVLPQLLLGSLVIREQTRAAQVTDGLSKTFIMTEDAGRPEHWRNGIRSYVREPLDSAWADPKTGIFVRDPSAKDGKCIVNCDNEGNIFSFHAGGVNVLFADGHVEFVDDAIEPGLMLAYMTPNKAD